MNRGIGMNKKIISIIYIIFLLFILILVVYPFIEIDTGSKIIQFRYSDSIDEFDKFTCYDDSYSYSEKRNITVTNIDFKKFMFFHVITVSYENGNKCATEYYLDESYIEDYINNAEIKYNDNNIDVAKLIENRKVITGNIRYSGNDYLNEVGYILNGKHQILYVFYIDDLLVIQVGLSDEGPKFIAYKKIEENFIGKRWTRTSDDTEILAFNNDGSFTYYCTCGNPVYDSDIYEYYKYDELTKEITLNSTYGKTRKIKVIEYDSRILKLDFEGERRTFNLIEE